MLMNTNITVMVFVSNKACTEILKYQKKQKNTVNSGIHPGECQKVVAKKSLGLFQEPLHAYQQECRKPITAVR